MAWGAGALPKESRVPRARGSLPTKPGSGKFFGVEPSGRRRGPDDAPRGLTRRAAICEGPLRARDRLEPHGARFHCVKLAPKRGHPERSKSYRARLDPDHCLRKGRFGKAAPSGVAWSKIDRFVQIRPLKQGHPEQSRSHQRRR